MKDKHLLTLIYRRRVGATFAELLADIGDPVFFEWLRQALVNLYDQGYITKSDKSDYWRLTAKGKDYVSDNHILNNKILERLEKRCTSIRRSISRQTNNLRKLEKDIENLKLKYASKN